jgi:hypothetical protein
MRKELTARELDREAHDRRERLASTLDELSASLTPGRMLDEVLSYAKNGGGNFLMGLGKSAANNPLPTLLISTGCALFLAEKGGVNFGGKAKESRSSSPRSEYDRSMRGQAAEGPGVLSSVAGAVSAAATTIADAIGSSASKVGSAATGVGSRLADAAKDTADAVAGSAAAAGGTMAQAGKDARSYAEDVASSAQQGASKAQRRATLLGRELNGRAADAFNEYPLVVAAGGLIVGAALAALLPRTNFEDQYMGAKSDTLKQAVTEGAGDGLNRVAASMEKVVTTVKAKAEEEDIIGSAKGGLDELTTKVGDTLKVAKEAINDEIGGISPARSAPN